MIHLNCSVYALAGIFCVCAAGALAQDASPGHPVSLLEQGTWTLGRPSEQSAETSVVSDTSAPDGSGKILRVTVRTTADPYYQIQLVHAVPDDLPEGTMLRYEFWARASAPNPMRAVVERSKAPYTSVLARSLTLTSQWQKVTLTGDAQGFGPGGISAHLQVGGATGDVDFAGVRLETLGTDPKIMAAREAISAAKMKERIERYRKGDITIQVRDARGRAVRNVTVRVQQTRHAFLFGCNFFGLDPANTSELEIAYQQRFTALFNYATLPFYWGAFEPRQGEPQYTRLEAMARWCAEHRVTVKGHPLVWHEVYPGWAPPEPDAAIPVLHQRVTDIVTHYHDLIHYWDVLNEANGAAGFSPANGESRWIKRDGPVSVVGTALGWARDAGQGNRETFIYNDYDTSENNVALLSGLQAGGKLPDAIGLQSHMHDGPWSLTKVWQVCETFSQFHRPIHFTETTVLSGPKRVFDYSGPEAVDWKTTPEDEEKQADYVTQFYTLLFSHPSVHAITWWDFSDRNAWLGAPAGMVRADMSPKPVYDRLMKLIHGAWWTNESGKSDARGLYRLRAFYGDYRITAEDARGHKADLTLSLPEQSAPREVVLSLK